MVGVELEQLMQHGPGSPRGSPLVRRRPSPSHPGHRVDEEQVPPTRVVNLPPRAPRDVLVDACGRAQTGRVQEDQPGPPDTRDQAALLEVTDHPTRHLP